MRFILIILTGIFSISGCKTTELITDSLGTIINVPQPEEQGLNNKINQWADSKTTEVLTDFKKAMPISMEKSIHYIKPSQLPKMYKSLAEANAELNSNVLKNKNNMIELKRNYKRVKNTLADFSTTQLWIKAELSKHTKDFHTIVMSGERTTVTGSGGDSSKNLISYCELNNIDEVACKSEPYSRDGNTLAETILYRNLVNNNEQYKEYFQWLDQEVYSLNKLANNIEKQGVEFEQQKFFKNASLSGCKNVTNFNFLNNYSLSTLVGSDSFRPNKTLIYDLANFKIVQSQSGGILLASTSRDSYNAPFIFATTSKAYTDGYIFQSSEKFVCHAGIKEYVSVLGVTKRINSFRTIHDNSQYYFFMANQ